MVFLTQKYIGIFGFALFWFPCLVSALYADEAGKIDYSVSTAGHGRRGVQYARLIANGTAVLTSSSVPDLLSLSPSDGGCYLSSRDLLSGKLLWRRDVCSMKNANYAVCAPFRLGFSNSQNSLVYTLDNRGVMRTWDEITGHMVHDRLFP